MELRQQLGVGRSVGLLGWSMGSGLGLYRNPYRPLDAGHLLLVKTDNQEPQI